MLSIAMAGVVLSSLPEAAQDMRERESVWDRQATLLSWQMPLWRVVNSQIVLFLLGICAFASGIIAVAWRR